MDTHEFRIARVVVGVDGSEPGHRALHEAVEEARTRHVPLEVVTAVDLTARVAMSADELWDHGRRVAGRAGRVALETLPADRVHVATASGRAAEVLYTRSSPDTLVVVGSRGHHRPMSLLLGSTSSALVGHAQGLVMVVHRRRIPDDLPVVAGLDGSPASERALGVAVDVAEQWGRRLLAVHAMPSAYDSNGMVCGPDDPRVQVEVRLLAELLAGVRVDHPDLDVEPVVSQGHPADVLLHHAQRASRAVVGRRGRGGLQGLVQGSVSRALVQEAACPVVVVPSG